MPKPNSKTVLFPASRRTDWRRANPCQVAGRVIPGFSRATLRRAGDPQGCTVAGPVGGRGTLRRGALHRVGLTATAGIVCPPAGNLLYDSGVDPTEHNIASSGPPVWVEITTVPFATFGTCPLSLKITLDAIDLHPATDDNQIDALVAPPGAASPSDFDSFPPAIAGAFAGVTGVYATYVLTDSPLTFTGPGIAYSVYIWPPFLPPNFNGSTMKYKNIRIQVFTA